MNRLTLILLLSLSLLAVFIQSAFPLLRNPLGAQVDLLPALMVYAGVYGGLGTLSLASSLSGLWYDSLSSNPLGSTIPGLFLVAFGVRFFRDLLVYHDPFVQVMLGFAAGAVAPAVTILLLLSMDQEPLVGWKSFWQLLVVAGGSALATPVFFLLFNRLHRLFCYPTVTQSSFRPDREIKRGRY